MSYDRDKLGTMTFEVSVSANKGAGLPDDMLLLLTACIKGEPLIMQVDGKDAFKAIPIGLDTDHSDQTVSHRATFRVERAPSKRPSRPPQDDGDPI